MRLLTELHQAARSLARAPVLAMVAVLSLGLGIGANATIFSFVNGILFRPLPFEQPHQLVDVSEHNPEQLCAGCAVGTSWPTLQLWRAAAGSFSALGAYRESGYTVAGEQEPERVGGALVSANLFPLLGVHPVLGRLLTEVDDRPGAPPVVLLGHGLWMRRFGGDSGLLGRTVRVNGVPRTVVGLMPPGFRFPEFASLWLPLAPEVQTMPVGDRSLGAIGRLGPGITLAAAALEMRGIAGRLAAERPAEYQGWTDRVSPLRQDLADDTSTQGFLLALAASGFVLLIACANLANLFLARATSRARELAVRVALGASRGRIAGQVLTESLLLGLLGGLFGLVLSLWGVRLLSGLINAEIPFWIRLGADWRLLLYTFLLSLAVGAAFGVVPAIRASRIDLNETLKTGSLGATAGRRDSRIRGALAVAQIALAIVLLAGAGVLVKSFLIMRRTDNLGYNPGGVLTARVELQAPRYQEPAEVRQLSDQLLERLAVQPMVEAVAVEHSLLLNSFRGDTTIVRLEGAAEAVPLHRGLGHGAAVTPEYFRVLEIPVLSGRAISAVDGPAAPGVVVVNRQAGSLLWPAEQPIGKRLRIGGGPWLTVVGVVGDVVGSPFARGNSPMLYSSAAQSSERGFRLLIRYHGDPTSLATTLKAVARTIDADEPVEDVMTLPESLARWVSPVRFMVQLLGVLSGIALALAAFGIYGVMSYLVARRTRELGIRMALGAEAAQLRRYVIRRALRLALFGVLIGLPAAFGLTRVLRRVLSMVTPSDPLVFALVAVLLAGIALAASWAPARRATRVDPLVALRAE
ncbi:MAG TPA: ABC transporter permease [Gemmatimonadales bacterium]|nr:ABC transporter permease [Gemmatimonadales bacterium]